jgi:uncharacterized membrane protein
MPFWAIYMIACGALILWGWRVSAWQTPALILLGLVGVRATAPLPEVMNEMASCTVWMAITYVVFARRAYLPAFLLGISTIVYLPLLVLGYRIQYMGLLPIASDAFLILAIGASGHDIFRKRRSRSGDFTGRNFLLHSSKGVVAQGSARLSQEDRAET